MGEADVAQHECWWRRCRNLHRKLANFDRHSAIALVVLAWPDADHVNHVVLILRERYGRQGSGSLGCGSRHAYDKHILQLFLLEYPQT
jgi:hypothetical protein